MEHKMASEEKSFEDLLEEALVAPSGGTVSLVGTLAKHRDAYPDFQAVIQTH
jgi:hypothetical protein